MVQNPLRIAEDHHRLMIEHMATARSHENLIKRLLIGRMVTTEVYAHPIRVSDVQVKGLEVQIYGRVNHKRKRSILLATHIAGITVVEASNMDPSSKEEGRHEQAGR
jgi:hypothetical protein